MTRLLYWAPRLLSIAFIVFISLFALDAVKEGPTALLMHLLPTIALSLLLALAWRREWIGAVFFALAGIYYIQSIVTRPTLATALKWNWSLVIAGPALLIALLFLLAWRTRTSTPRAQ